MLTILNNNIDITKYIVSCTWEGEAEQAARRLNFSIVFNTQEKDKNFNNIAVNLGDEIIAKFKDVTIFKGKIFMASRETDSYKKDFVAYDPLIYLAKSTINKKFKDITVESVLKQVANDFNLSVKLDKGLKLDTKVNFIADNKKATEVLKQALDFQRAADNKKYIIAGVDEENNIFIGDNSTDDIATFKLSANTNVIKSSHSESIEDMINHIDILDEHGEIVGTIENEKDIKAFGKITSSYKIDGKQNTQVQARNLLKSITMNSSIEAIGNITCVSGKNIEIQEEQLKGKFFIKSDSHTFEGGKYDMNLTLEFTKLKEDNDKMKKDAKFNKGAGYDKAEEEAKKKEKDSNDKEAKESKNERKSI